MRTNKHKHKHTDKDFFDSNEEGEFICTLGYALNLNENEIMNNRDNTTNYGGNWDWTYTLPSSQLTMLVDYDGSRWHGESRIKRDTTKTLDAVNKHSNVIAIRVRTCGCPPLPSLLNHERIHIIDFLKKDTFGSIALKLFECVKTVPINQTTNSSLNNAKQLMISINSITNATYKKAYERLLTISRNDTNWINKMLAVHGAQSRIESYVNGIEYLRTEWEMGTKDLTTFMSDSVAARIHEPTFRSSLEYLRTEWEMGTKDLTTFMSNSVAARIHEPTFRTSFGKLCKEWDLETLCKIMNDSFAVSLTKSPTITNHLIDLIRILKDNQIDLSKLKRFMRSPYICDENIIRGLRLKITSVNQDESLTDYLNEYDGKSYMWHKGRASDLKSI